MNDRCGINRLEVFYFVILILWMMVILKYNVVYVLYKYGGKMIKK